jgi:hypothetical protein
MDCPELDASRVDAGWTGLDANFGLAGTSNERMLAYYETMGTAVRGQRSSPRTDEGSRLWSGETSEANEISCIIKRARPTARDRSRGRSEAP